MEISEYAVVTKALPHGENGLIVSVFSESHGILKGFARHIKSKHKPLIFVPGNVLKITHYCREGTMGKLTGEPYRMYMYSCMDSHEKIKLVLAACNCLNIAFDTIEKERSGELFKNLMLYLEQIKHGVPFAEAAFSLSLLVKKILEFCGYGLRLNRCIVSDNQDIDSLTFLSPKSGASVSELAGRQYAKLMLRLPKAFITDNYRDVYSMSDVVQALNIVDIFLKKSFNKEVEEISWIINMASQMG